MYANEVEHSIRYLNSDAAVHSLERDPYWPKWDSPWWHMLLLHEMGEAKIIPERALAGCVTALNRMPLKIFPILAADLPAGVDVHRGTSCHCQLGSIYQVLSAADVDVDTEIPWIRPWFLKYQMSDGGLSCDNAAYLVKDEVPSSMVGLIACFEAVLLHNHNSWTADEEAFLERGANFLIQRKLMNGSDTTHNAAERESAKKWMQLCFPRFYYYDILRGLNALTSWAEKAEKTIPFDSIQTVVEALERKSATGDLRCERLSFAGCTTLLPSPDGQWLRNKPAILFPLLQESSTLGRPSPFLTQQWVECKRRLTKVVKL